MNPHRKLWIYLQPQENIQREASWRPKPPPLALSNVKERCLHSELLSLSLKLSRATVRTTFSCLHLLCLFICQFSEFIATGESWSKIWMVNQGLHLMGRLPLNIMLTLPQSTCQSPNPNPCSFSSFVNKTPRHMDSLTSIPEAAVHHSIEHRAMASVLDVLTHCCFTLSGRLSQCAQLKDFYKKFNSSAIMKSSCRFTLWNPTLKCTKTLAWVPKVKLKPEATVMLHQLFWPNRGQKSVGVIILLCPCVVTNGDPINKIIKCPLVKATHSQTML